MFTKETAQKQKNSLMHMDPELFFAEYINHEGDVSKEDVIEAKDVISLFLQKMENGEVSLKSAAASPAFSMARTKVSADFVGIKRINKTDMGRLFGEKNDGGLVKIVNMTVHDKMNKFGSPSILFDSAENVDYKTTDLVVSLWDGKGNIVCAIVFNGSDELDEWVKKSFLKSSTQFDKTSTTDLLRRTREKGTIPIFSILSDLKSDYKVYANNFNDMSNYLNYKVPGFAGNFYKIAGKFLNNFIGEKNVGVLEFK